MKHDILSAHSPVPGVVTGVQGRYPYVVWNPPDAPNGVITGYRLVFSRSGTSTTRTRTTTTDQTFYIIQSSDIPWTSGDFRVTVSSFPSPFISWTSVAAFLFGLSQVAARNSAGFGAPSSTFTLTLDTSNKPYLSHM